MLDFSDREAVVTAGTGALGTAVVCRLIAAHMHPQTLSTPEL